MSKEHLKSNIYLHLLNKAHVFRNMILRYYNIAIDKSFHLSAYV